MGKVRKDPAMKLGRKKAKPTWFKAPMFSEETQHISCPNGVMRYLLEQRKEAMHSVKRNLAKINVKIKKGHTSNSLKVTSTNRPLVELPQELKEMMSHIAEETVKTNQPGVQKFFTYGTGVHVLKSLEKEHRCVIEVECHADVRVDQPPVEDCREGLASLKAEASQLPEFLAHEVRYFSFLVGVSGIGTCTAT